MDGWMNGSNTWPNRPVCDVADGFRLNVVKQADAQATKFVLTMSNE